MSAAVGREWEGMGRNLGQLALEPYGTQTNRLAALFVADICVDINSVILFNVAS